MKHLITFLITLLIVSCASKHPGRKAENLSKDDLLGLVISGRKVTSLSDKYHSFIDFTFENTGPDWKRIKSIEFSCGKKCDDKINIIVGKDIVIWAEAMKEKKAISDYNSKLLLGSLAVAGAVTAGVSNSNGTTAAGLGAYAVGMGGLAAKGISKNLGKLQTSKQVPEQHIYSPFAVPSELFVRRWILLNHKASDSPLDAILTVNTINNKTQKYKIRVGKIKKKPLF